MFFDKEILSAEEYLKLKSTRPWIIKHARIVPCALGSNDFGGGIEVTYRYPVYPRGL